MKNEKSSKAGEVKVLPEKPINYYRDRLTPVSNWYWEYENKGIIQSAEPVYRPRKKTN